VKLYFDAGGVTIYHGNALEFMRSGLVPTTQVLVSDPPYGMNYKSGRTGESVIGDEDATVRDEVLAMWGGPALVFGHWRVPPPADTKIRLVWDKWPSPGMGDLALPWGPSDEEIYVIGTGWVWGQKRMGSVFRVPKVPAPHMQHPTQKPVEIMKHLLDWCRPEWTILDPFMGSGTTLVAAKALGRRAIGVELEERYCEIAAGRLSQEVLGL
jgi:site-specific DNA-methyltransferase (adenine-specific)